AVRVMSGCLLAARAFVVRLSAPTAQATVRSLPVIAGLSYPAVSGNYRSLSLHLLDSDTLVDLPGTAALDPGDCASAPVADSARRTAVIAIGGGTSAALSCRQGSSLRLRMIDLHTWQWSQDIVLDGEP